MYVNPKWDYYLRIYFKLIDNLKIMFSNDCCIEQKLLAYHMMILFSIGTLWTQMQSFSKVWRVEYSTDEPM